MTTSCAAANDADVRGSGVAGAVGSGDRAGVVALIGTAECHGDSQCATVGVGSRPCGGPQAYLAYSVAMTDAAALQRAVSAQAGIDRAAQKRLGMAGTCNVILDPGAFCKMPSSTSVGPGACRLAPTGRGAGSAVR